MITIKDKETINLSKVLLNEIYNHNSDANNNTAEKLIELLESKEDPDSIDLYLIESLYQYLEKLSILENHLKKYIKVYNNKVLIGNKLNDLHNYKSGYGTSKLFD